MSGDVSALGELYEHYADGLFAYAVSILRRRTLAEDAVSESFVRLYCHASKGKHIISCKALLFTICRNAALDILRQARRSVFIAEDETVAASAVGDTLAVREALNDLDVGEKEIVTLYCMAGFKHREIAELLELPEGTVRWKYREALKKLRKELGVDIDG